MYQIIEAPRRMSLKEITEEFDGKWVFVVRLEGPLYGWFDTAVPVVVADKPFEGFNTGIYERLSEEYGGNYSDLTLLPNEYNVFGFDEVSADAG